MTTALQPQAKEQAKLVELGEAAKAAAEAVEEAKQKAIKRREEVDWPQAGVPTSDSVAHLHKSLRDTFQALARRVEAQSLITQLDAAVTGISGMLAATPTPPSTDLCNDDVEMAPSNPISDAVARAFLRSWENEGGALTSEEREAKKQKSSRRCVVEESDLAKTLASEQGFPHMCRHQKQLAQLQTSQLGNLDSW